MLISLKVAIFCLMSNCVNSKYQGIQAKILQDTTYQFTNVDKKVTIKSNCESNQRPHFQGNTEEMMLMIAKKLVYPRQATDKKLQGAVKMRLVVNSFGEIAQVIVLESNATEFSQAAINAVKSLPNFSAAKDNSCKVIYEFPLYFVLK